MSHYSFLYIVKYLSESFEDSGLQNPVLTVMLCCRSAL